MTDHSQNNAVSEPGRFAALEADHPCIGQLCPVCQKPLQIGEVPALVAIGPGDVQERRRAQEGREYNATAVLTHEACAHDSRAHPSVMYHAAPRDARTQIGVEGLRGDPDGWDDLVWVWDHLPTAAAYAGGGEDIYKVDVDGLPAEPGTNPPSQHGGLAWAVTGPIPPSRLSLLDANTIAQHAPTDA
jgi:hypothetical protein